MAKKLVSDNSNDEDVEYKGHFCSECSAMAPAVGNQHSFTMARSALLLTSFIITLDSMIYRITNFSLAGRQKSSLLPTTCDQLP